MNPTPIVPKLNVDSLQLVNTKIEGDESIILELTLEGDKFRLREKDREKPHKISDNPGEIAQTIVGLAEKHVQEFTQETDYIRPTTIVPELDI
jgi:hypothetical protein